MNDKGIRCPINDNIELLRLLAAFGIVLFHGGRDVAGQLAGYGGLVVFILLLVLFLPRSGPRAGVYAIRVRFQRLLIPWAAWCVVYALAHMLKGRGPAFLQGLLPFGILTGTNAHLWYLPFAFIVSCLILLVEAVLPRGAEGAQSHKPGWNHAAAALCAICTLAGIVVLARWRASGGGQGLPEPLGQWAHAAPAVLAGLVFRYEASGLARWSFAAGLGAVSSYAWAIGDPGTGIAYLAGTAGFMVLSTVPVFVDPRIRVWSACAYGVYLVHPLVYQGLTRLIWVPMDIIGATVTFCMCLVAVYWARKIDFVPLRRIL